MKTLILYATKYGAAREIAERIAKRLDGAELFDLKQGAAPELTGYDRVVVGSSIYAGSIRKEAKKYLQTHESQLCEKCLGLFLSGIGAEGSEGFFSRNFSQKLQDAAGAKAFLGGIFQPDKVGSMERRIFKAATKSAEYANTISDDKIDAFALALSSDSVSTP